MPILLPVGLLLLIDLDLLVLLLSVVQMVMMVGVGLMEVGMVSPCCPCPCCCCRRMSLVRLVVVGFFCMFETSLSIYISVPIWFHRYQIVPFFSLKFISDYFFVKIL